MRTDHELSREPLTATLDHSRPAVVGCTVTGEVDILTAPVLREQLTKAANAACRDVVVDLTAVTFFAAAGVSVLDEVQRARGDRPDLVLVGARPHVSRVLDLCRLGCRRCATFEEALASCGPGRN